MGNWLWTNCLSETTLSGDTRISSNSFWRYEENPSTLSHWSFSSPTPSWKTNQASRPLQRHPSSCLSSNRRSMQWRIVSFTAQPQPQWLNAEPHTCFGERGKIISTLWFWTQVQWNIPKQANDWMAKSTVVFDDDFCRNVTRLWIKTHQLMGQGQWQVRSLQTRSSYE